MCDYALRRFRDEFGPDALLPEPFVTVQDLTPAIWLGDGRTGGGCVPGSEFSFLGLQQLSNRAAAAANYFDFEAFDKTISCHSSPDPGQPFFNLIICRARLSPSPG